MSNDSQSAAWQHGVVGLSRTVIGATIVLALYWARPVLIPIALATLLTFLLNPLVRRLQLLGLGRLGAVVVAVSVAGFGLTLLGVTGSRQVSGMISQLPENTAKIVAKVKALKSWASGPTAHRFEQMVEEISRELQLTAETPPASADEDSGRNVDRIVVTSNPFDWTMVTGHLGSAVEMIATLAFALVLLVFFLLEREGLRDRIVLLAGKSKLTLTSKALEDATTRVSRYIAMVAIVNGGFGLLLTVGLLALGVPYALLWGCVAATFRFIPYVGPWIGAVFPITMSLATSEGWWQPLAVFGFVLILELATNNIVEPLAFGRTTGVAPTALLISAAFWLYLWGPIGLILSAPFAVSLVVIGKNIPQLAFFNILLGDEPALSDSLGFYQRLLVQNEHAAKSIVRQRLQEVGTEPLFDDLILPALNSVKRDIRRGHLSEDESGHVLTVLGDAISDTRVCPLPGSDTAAPDRQNASASMDNPNRLKLVVCTAEGEPDRAALEMLQDLLDCQRWDVELVARETLTSELALRVAKDPPAAICIAALQPGSIAHARYLCKKLRIADADVPIVIGRWGRRTVPTADRERLMEVGANAVTTSFADTRRWLDSRSTLA